MLGSLGKQDLYSNDNRQASEALHENSRHVHGGSKAIILLKRPDHDEPGKVFSA
jgi:hypothetical protein